MHLFIYLFLRLFVIFGIWRVQLLLILFGAISCAQIERAVYNSTHGQLGLHQLQCGRSAGVSAAGRASGGKDGVVLPNSFRKEVLGCPAITQHTWVEMHI